MFITNSERELINLLKSNIPGRYQRVLDKDKQNYHVTVRDASSYNVYKFLIDAGYTLNESNRIHSSAYTGKNLIFNNEEVYIVVRDKNSNGVHYMKRKDVTPDRIGLGNKTFTDAKQMRDTVLAGLTNCTTNENTIALMSILDVVDTDGEFQNTHVLIADKSRITSDFGEVVSAYVRVKKGQEVFFPKESNYPGIDFFADGVGVSAKGDKGSSRLSTIDYVDAISKLGDTNEAQVLKHLSNRRIYEMIDTAADNCAELNFWKNKLNGITADSMLSYISNCTYDDYIEDLKSSQNSAVIGLPKKEAQCRTYWTNKDINPLLFTLCTFVDRYYSEKNVDKLSDLVVQLFNTSNIEFEYFDYDVSANNVNINILPITQYKVWKINYWGNAASALNNWPAVKGIE
tara:strand:+ start:786 stop:1988 length:1203 start_codon:yes stop_codon:yes gene_type:complete